MSKDVFSARKQRSLETKKKLLFAGREVFIEHGFQKTTISQIIKKAETGYGTAYVYFKNKDDLLIVLMDDVMNQFYTIAERVFQPVTKQEARSMIQQQVHAFLQMAEMERQLLQVVEEAIGASDEVRYRWSAIRERFIERIVQDITYSQNSGLARKDLNCFLVARSWFFANEMFLWEIVRNERDFSLGDIVHTLTEMYMGGLYS
ncbi:Fatty acid metabolism regulator protein [Bacillus rhizoplanae]|uniref:Fatty acid metabolism regulator protein n=1 Tax=Bacillus rhizoplanae TaxID=2880966 RepID=A0ABM8YFU9_9BACI|nr:TetR/AcrR family transcriptional regulator [Bacillus rhizoplanae]CAG9614715.1 Fatty acid metabolism regulator protein [Bacillus rhizoplanae]